MDAVLARLLELSEDAAKPAATGGARPDQAVLTEAQHLWKTLETLTATQKAVELQAHDATFSRMLACIHCVLKARRTWTAGANGGSTTSNGTNKSVFELANRVLVKVGCRGEQEREAILREGFAPLLVESALGSDTSRLSSSETVALLHSLQTLAFDTQHRIELMKCDGVRAALGAMRTFPRELNVQVFGCKFLQFMAYEEAVKELIIEHDGIDIVLEALSSFGSAVQLATSASDMLYFLSLDLESAFASQETKYVSTTHAIMDPVIRLMQTHRHIQPVQVHGIAILLTFASSHASARLYLSSHDASRSLWEIATGTAVTNDDAMADTIDLLELILEAPECFQQLQSDMSARGTSQDASANMCALHCLSTLISCLECKLNRAQYASKSHAIGFVIDRLRSLVESTRTRHAQSPVEETQHDDGHRRIQVTDHPRGIHPQSQRAIRTTSQPSRFVEDDQASDDSHRFLDDESPTKDANSPYGYFDEFVRDHDDSRDCGENESVEDQFSELGHPEADVWSGNKNECLDVSPRGHNVDQKRATPRPKDWQNECEHVRRRHRELEGEYHLLQQNYQILLRRAQEQSKLLNIQNARIKHHMDVHQHVLDRVRTLETALADAQRKHQVERELRLAEVAQSEKISSSLHEAMKEITTLNRQNSTTSRELQQKEKLRVDYQQKVSVVRQQQQKLEFERDDAVVQMLSMRSEQLALSKKLEESRREAEEALRMREEDADAPKLSAFSEMLSLSPSARLRKVSSYTLTTKRVAAEASERQQRHHEHRKSTFAGSINRVVRPVDASLMRKASMYGGQVLSDRSIRSADVMVIDGQVHDDDHDDEYMMEPPKDDIATTFGSSPFPQRGLDKFEIERTLRVVYDGFDKSPDSNGVHIATIRRFFADCGIVQPPLVAGDVDTILTRVLNQAQENRKRVMVRKDFTISTFPGGIGSGSSQKRATEAKRFRFFDEESYFEAVTLLVMRRFPRFEAKKALEVFITDYLHPMQRQQQQQQLLLLRRSSSTSSTAGSGTVGGNVPTRSGSIIMSSGSSGNTSPTAACIGILKSVLNGLALHIGRDDDGGLRHEDPLFHSKQDNSATTILLASGHHNRKPRREDVVYSMLEMHAVLAREYKPLATICEFYSAMHHTPRDALLKEDGFAMPLTFELLLAFAMDFEIIPSFMDRLSLKHLHSEVSAYLKTYMTFQKKLPPPHAIDTEMLKKVAFSMALARLAMELFGTKREYETPEKQITALLQWLDNSVGREKIQKKAMLPIVIKFSRMLYAIRA